MKRSFDFMVSLSLIILLFPLLAFIAIKVKRDLGSPIFFRQKRPGQYGVPFEMIKFRTMKSELDKYGCRQSELERLTPFGKTLRSLSLDELPELFNVLKGEMSLVGPRPLLMEYLPLYNNEQKQRHNVLPGITGWAQINGRNAISWDQKFKLDIWYVKNRSFFLDVKILFLTLQKVTIREGVFSRSGGAVSKFKGSKD